MRDITLDDKLEAIRERHNLSWKEIYNALGVSRETLRAWRMNGALKWSDIVKLGELGVKYWEFFDEQDPYKKGYTNGYRDCVDDYSY